MSRWLMLSLGLGIAAVALYVLLTGPLPGPAAPASTAADLHDEGQTARGGARPTEQIDADSRRELREVLRQAGREEGDVR